jgi:DNA polymerase-3 subunit beta
MKAGFLVENIEKFLPVISRVLPLHSQIPVLSNVLIETDKTGINIYATNLELGVKIKIPAKVEEEGVTTIPGKQFIEALSSFPKDIVNIMLDKDKFVLSSRGMKVAFQTISKDEFPTLFEEKGEKVHVFGKNEIIKAFSNLTFSVSSDESRPELTGILVSQKRDHIDIVATDGFRLSLKKIKGERMLDDESFVILPSRLVSEALSIKDEEVSFFLLQRSNQAIFETKDMTLVGRVINGEFPNYERVIPTTFKTDVVVDREELLQQLKLSSIFARDAANIIRVKLEEGKIKIFASSSGLGEGESVVDVEQKGEDNEIAFNIKFLTDLLRNLTGKTIVMHMISAIDPALFNDSDDPDFQHIIMPVRMQE